MAVLFLFSQQLWLGSGILPAPTSLTCAKAKPIFAFAKVVPVVAGLIYAVAGIIFANA
jgi:hypothetical protein